MKFNKLFSPFSLGKNITLRNRIVLPPMNTNYGDPDGSINSKYSDYYVERGKGGTGLLIVAPGYVDSNARKRSGSILLTEDKFVPKLKLFTDRVHQTGAFILQQLNHNGRLLTSTKDLKTAFSGMQAVGPSAIPHLVTGDIPKVLNSEEIQILIDKFGQNALRAKQAGYDGVEVHGAHGYLLNQFLSRHSNRRTDEYGGTPEKRMRFPLEVVRKVREMTGPDFLISYRLSVIEYSTDGVTLEEAIAFCQQLETEGIDAIHITAGNSETPETSLRLLPPGSIPRGCYSDLARAVKGAVSIPVIVVGRINTPEIAEAILARGDADLVATGRGLIADPYWPNKVLTGNRDQVRRCLGCNQGCMEYLAKEKPLTCLYNPEVGREGDPLRAASDRKKVWVIGGGPGGMEAARTAALRGHEVTLFEKNPMLGGQVLLAAIPPGKEEFSGVTEFFTQEVMRLGVNVHLAEEVTADQIVQEKPDAVVLATGSTPIIPRLPGMDQNNVVTARDVLAGKEIGNRVVMCGGGLVGIETAIFLHRIGKEVLLIEMLEEIAADAGSLNKERLRQELAETTVRVKTKTKLLSIEGDKLRVMSEQGEEEIETDTLVLAIGGVRDNKLFEAIAAKPGLYQGEVYQVGDCVSPRKVLEAVHEGHEAARSI